MLLLLFILHDATTRSVTVTARACRLLCACVTLIISSAE